MQNSIQLSFILIFIFMFASCHRNSIHIEDGELGSKTNPVKCNGPSGEEEYLVSLRTEAGNEPVSFERLGNFEDPNSDKPLDGYKVTFGDSEMVIYFNMYHPDYVESRAIKGFKVKR